MDLTDKYLSEGGSFGKTDKSQEKLNKAIFKITDKLSATAMMIQKLPNDISKQSRAKMLDGLGDAIDELNKYR